jgi:putative ABC transport system permease protein
MSKVRIALRRLLAAPGFSLAVIGTLGIAVSTVATTLTVVNAVMFAELPFPEGDRLVVVDHVVPGARIAGGLGVGRGIFRLYAQAQEVETAALFIGFDVTVTNVGEPRRVRVLRATPSFSGLTGAKPTLGRWFNAGDAARGAPRVAVISHGFNAELFGHGVDSIGRAVTLDNVPYTIVGMLAPGFRFPNQPAQLLVPQIDDTERFAGPWGYHSLFLLRPTATAETFRTRLENITAGSPALFPADKSLTLSLEKGLRPNVMSLRQSLNGETSRILWLLLGMAGLVVVVAAANVANLVLVRSDQRVGEHAVRLALGATRLKVTTEWLVESLLLTGGGAVLAFALAQTSAAPLGRALGVNDLYLQNLDLNLSALIITVTLSGALGLGLGLLPVFQQRAPFVATLHGRYIDPGAGRRGWRRKLLAVQLATAAVLLVSAGLLFRSLGRIAAVDPGFATTDRFIFRLHVSSGDAQGLTRDTTLVHEQFLERIRTAASVRSAGVGTGGPLRAESPTVQLELSQAVPVDSPGLPAIAVNRVSWDYRRALGVPLLLGRDLTSDETNETSFVALVNDALSNRYFGDENPIGKQVRPSGVSDGWLTIVGVVGNVATNGLDEMSPVPQLLVPLRTRMPAPDMRVGTYVMQTVNDPAKLIPELRRIRDEIDPGAVIEAPEPLTALVHRAAAIRRALTTLVGSAAVAGVVIGVIGVYAFVSYIVTTRTREIALRLAVGGERINVALMLTREISWAIVGGISAGICASLLAARIMDSGLFGVTWYDPTTYAVVAISLLILSCAAGVLPAYRATRLAPIQWLR